MIFIDISAWQINGTTLSFRGTAGIGDMDPAFSGADCSDPKPYPANSYWHWATEAPLEMMKRLNFKLATICRPLPQCNYNEGLYYKNIHSTIFEPYSYPSIPDPSGDPTDNIMDYYLFHNDVLYNYRPNLTTAEMTFHTFKEEELGTTHRPLSQVILCYKVYPIHRDEAQQGIWNEHWLETFYGTITCK